MSFRDALKAASETVNSVLGVACDHHSGVNVTNNTHVIIDRNKAVLDNIGIIVGYRCEASILKSEVPKILSGDYFIEVDTEIRWEISVVTKETSTKWYVNIIEI